MKIKENERSNKKKEPKEVDQNVEARTVPLMPLKDHCENRGKKYRVSKML